MTKKDIQNEPILPHPDRERYLEEYHADQKDEYKDFGLDAFEEVLGKVVGI